MKMFLAMLCLVLISSAFLMPGCASVKVESPVINSSDTNAAGSTVAATQVMVSEIESPPQSTGLPVINSFTANPSTISAGNSVTLSWDVSNATSVAIRPGLGNFASSGTKLVSPTATTTYTLTATNEAGSTMATVQVVVLKTYAHPPLPEFAVTNVTASAAPSSFTGACPHNFNLVANITANGPGIVTYFWERSDGENSPTQTVNFAEAGSQTVTTGWSREASGASWVRVRTLTPNEMVSNQASLNLICQKPLAVTKVEVKAITPTFTGVCPHYFDLIANITANGPGTVTYCWERSDGGASPTQSLIFTGAGTASPTIRWTREASGSYWVRIRILTPNDMVSDQANFTLTCE
jgi:hypothetical protein